MMPLNCIIDYMTVCQPRLLIGAITSTHEPITCWPNMAYSARRPHCLAISTAVATLISNTNYYSYSQGRSKRAISKACTTTRPPCLSWHANHCHFQSRRLPHGWFPLIPHWQASAALKKHNRQKQST